MGWKRELWPEWEVESVIGSGAYGDVYKIRRQDIGGVYYAALKVISIPRDEDEINQLRNANMSDEQIARYYRRFVNDLSREFSVMEKLKGNTNIVSYEDHKIIEHKVGFGWDVLIRMELLMPLPAYLQHHEFGEAETIKLGIDICNALKICQCENIIHRDIKPGNIFVTSHGDFKLGDFSVALTNHNTTGGSPKGTYTFMAPEVYYGKKYDNTIDIYSLGLILYKMLNRGRLPFLPLPPQTITHEMVEQANYKRLCGAVLPRPIDASIGMSNIIMKACAYYPNKRYRNAGEFLSALEFCRHAQGPMSVSRQVSQCVKNIVETLCYTENEAVNPNEVNRGYFRENSVIEDSEKTERKENNGPAKKTMKDFFVKGGDL